MFKNINYTTLAGISATLILITACSSVTPTQQQAPQQTSQSLQKSGVKLWADNCAFCHNMRSPDSYSDVQWDVAVLHMRVRANLPADEAKAIVEYLKSAN